MRHSPGEDTSLAALAREGRQRKLGSPGSSSDTSSPSGGGPLRPSPQQQQQPQPQQHHLDAQRVRPASPHRPALSELQMFWQQPQHGLYAGLLCTASMPGLMLHWRVHFFVASGNVLVVETVQLLLAFALHSDVKHCSITWDSGQVPWQCL